MSLERSDPSIVTFKHTFIVSQIFGCPLILSWLVLLEAVNKSFLRYR